MTPQQSKVLRFVKARIGTDGVAPSYVEIANHIGQASRSSVHRIVKALVRDGYLIQGFARARSLRLPAPVTVTNCDGGRVPLAVLDAAVNAVRSIRDENTEAGFVSIGAEEFGDLDVAVAEYEADRKAAGS